MKDTYYTVAHRSQDEIDSFKTRYQNFPTKLIPDIFKQSLGLTALDWKQSISWGSSHVIYSVTVKEQKNPLLLRANLGFNKEPEVIMKIEQIITQQVAELGVPTNNILFVDVSRKKFPFDFQIQEILEGKDVEDHFSGTKEDYDLLSFQLGKYTAQIHTLTYKEFGKFDGEKVKDSILIGTKKTFFDYIIVCLDEDIAYLVTAGVISLPTARNIRKLFDLYKDIINISKGSLVHHDLADHNIMHQGTKITGIFDWEACVVGDPILDL